MNKKKFPSKKDVEELKEIVQQLNKSFFLIKETVDQLRIDFDLAQEQNPFNINVWLKPSELAAILKISTSTVTKYRNEGLLKKTSVKKMVRGKRTDFYYHRINAIKDISLIKPIQISTLEQKKWATLKSKELIKGLLN